MRFVRHPFFEQDLIGIVDHILDVTEGDTIVALRRLEQFEDLLESIRRNPTSGARLSGKLEGWLVRHGGSGHRLTVVFKPDVEAGIVFLALAAFGGRDWIKLASARQATSQ